jgi:hypothetical protein
VIAFLRVVARRQSVMQVMSVDLLRLPAGNHQQVGLSGDREIVQPEAGHRHDNAVGILADLLDVIGRIVFHRLKAVCAVEQIEKTIKADG